MGTTGHVFADLPAPDEPSSALFENSKNLASSSCRSIPLDTSKTAERGEVLGKELQNCAIPAPRFILSTDPKPLDVVQFSLQNLSHFGWVEPGRCCTRPARLLENCSKIWCMKNWPVPLRQLVHLACKAARSSCACNVQSAHGTLCCTLWRVPSMLDSLWYRHVAGGQA